MPRAEHDALVAYVVVDRQRMNEHVAGLASVLRSHLATKLPDYMVPWQFIELEALPLTPNGKVDRLALSLQDEYLAGLKKERVAPRDELEANLAKVWEQVLGLKSIGIRDNFFELGGQSLLAARLFAQRKPCFLL